MVFAFLICTDFLQVVGSRALRHTLEGASHVVMISNPREVAEVVMTGVRTCAAQSD